MAIYGDGNFPSGAPILTIGVTGYRCNSFSVTEEAAVVQVNDNSGEHDGAVVFRDRLSFTAEIQVPTSAATLAQSVANSTTSGLFSYTHAGTALTWMIITATEAKPSQGVWVQTLNGQAKKN